MSFVKNMNKYIKTRCITKPWRIHQKYNNKFNYAIVIPSFSENNFLFKTLDSIEKNNPEILNKTIIIIVVNNSKKTKLNIKNNNYKTLKLLYEANYSYSIGIIDATSQGYELPSKYAGVGLARKIGIDLTIPLLKNEHSLIFSTDADTILSKDYLKTVIDHFNKNNIEAAVVGFKHQKAENKYLNEEILNYENFLIETANKIQSAGSPYGYVAMGSTMVCNLKSYIAVGGMPKRKAAEDFYFLQELAKYRSVHNINNILVYPSSRSVSRVHLGTGFRMEQVKRGININNLYFSDEAFKLLSFWIKKGTHSWKKDILDLLSLIEKKNKNLNTFLINEGINNIWLNLQSSSPTQKHFIKQFHRWFDGLKTIRLLKLFSKID